MAISLRSTATSRTASNATLTLSATKPAGTAQGDIMLAFVIVGENGSVEPEFTAPSGWALVTNASDNASGPSNYIKGAVYWKAATNSEPSTYTFSTTLATSSRFAVMINSYIGVNTTSPIGSGEIGVSNGTTASVPDRPTGSITTSVSRWEIIFAGDRNNSTFTAPNGFTQRAFTNGQTPGGVVFDSNGYVAPGTHSYNVISSTSSSTGFGILFTLVDGDATAPVLNAQRPAANLVDLRTSVVGDGSSLTYNDPVRLSGPSLTWSRLTSEIFLFAQSTGTTPSVYTFSIQQANNQTDSEDIQIEPASYGVVNIASPRRPSGSTPGNSWIS